VYLAGADGEVKAVEGLGSPERLAQGAYLDGAHHGSSLIQLALVVQGAGTGARWDAYRASGAAEPG
jgi:hypothetical protein